MKTLPLAIAALAFATPLLAHPDHNESEATSPEQVGTEYMVMETSANEAAQGPFLRGGG